MVRESGMKISDALTAASDHPETRQLYFTTPLSVEIAKGQGKQRPPPSPSRPNAAVSLLQAPPRKVTMESHPPWESSCPHPRDVIAQKATASGTPLAFNALYLAA